MPPRANNKPPDRTLCLDVVFNIKSYRIDVMPGWTLQDTLATVWVTIPAFVRNLSCEGVLVGEDDVEWDKETWRRVKTVGGVWRVRLMLGIMGQSGSLEGKTAL